MEHSPLRRRPRQQHQNTPSLHIFETKSSTLDPVFEEAPSPLSPVTSVHAPSMAVGDNRGAIRGAMAPERATFHRAVLFLHLAVVGLLRQWLVHPPAHQCVTVVDI